MLPLNAFWSSLLRSSIVDGSTIDVIAVPLMKSQCTAFIVVDDRLIDDNAEHLANALDPIAVTVYLKLTAVNAVHP